MASVVGTAAERSLHGTALFKAMRLIGESIGVEMKMPGRSEGLTPRSVGSLIALFERSVGLCAELMNVNAYDQPGVEAGKQAAGRFVDLQREILKYLRGRPDSAFSAEELAQAIGVAGEVEAVFHRLAHLAANADHRIERRSGSGATPKTAQFGVVS